MQRLFCVFNKYEFSIKDKLKLFDVLVSPVLNYSSEVSGYFESKYIENVHLNYLRKLLCVNTSTNLSGLYGELGRVPLIIIRKVHMFRCWLKLLKLNEQSPVKQMYLLLKKRYKS
mgnify:CR=1 FL=1